MKKYPKCMKDPRTPPKKYIQHLENEFRKYSPESFVEQSNTFSFLPELQKLSDVFLQFSQSLFCHRASWRFNTVLIRPCCPETTFCKALHQPIIPLCRRYEAIWPNNLFFSPLLPSDVQQSQRGFNLSIRFPEVHIRFFVCPSWFSDLPSGLLTGSTVPIRLFIVPIRLFTLPLRLSTVPI